MAIPVVPVVTHLVETATAFGTWTEAAALECTSASEGAGQVIGEATLRQRYGVLRLPGETGQPALVAPADYLGKWVRITYDGDPIWHGYVTTATDADDGGGNGMQTIRCAGLAGVLDGIWIKDGWERKITSGGDVAVYMDSMPPVNAIPGGDCSAGTYTVNGRSCHVFARSGEDNLDTDAIKWTAYNLVQYMLVAYGNPYDPVGEYWNGSIEWAISDPDNCLAYKVDSADFNGFKLLDAINTLISPRRGLTWFLSVSGSTATINVRSISPVSISSPDGYTLPACSDTASPDLSGLSPDEVSVTYDTSSEYDYIEVIGARPWVTITLSYYYNETGGGSLIKGWTAEAETAWDGGASAGTGHVWQRFLVAGYWTGAQMGSTDTGIRWDLMPATGTVLTGERKFSAGGESLNPQALEFTRDLPASQDFGSLRTGPRQTPLALASYGGYIEDLGGASGSDIPATITKSLEVQATPGAILIGTGGEDQEDVSRILGDNTDTVLIVTLGVREPSPLKVAWLRPSGQWRRDFPRTLTVHMPECEQWVILKDTVTGFTGGTLDKASADEVLRDDLPQMQQALALLRSYYSVPAVLLSYKIRGEIQTDDDSRPATLIESVSLSSTRQPDVNSVITRRAWDFTEDGFGTSISTDRIIPDVGAIK